MIPQIMFSLLIEIINRDKENIICGIILRQHNDPSRFMNHFAETVEIFSRMNGKLLENCVYLLECALPVRFHSLSASGHPLTSKIVWR
jgi:hypothetical protein